MATTVVESEPAPRYGLDAMEALDFVGLGLGSAAAAVEESAAGKDAPAAAPTTTDAALRGHSRQGSLGGSSAASAHSSADGSLSYELADVRQGVVVAMHRKMIPQEGYFLSIDKYRPVLFGLPLIVACPPATTCLDVYKSVWLQVERLVSPLPPKDAATAHNHATDCDDSLGYEYPFVLKVVSKGGCWCGRCPWASFCRGCALPCSPASEFESEFGASFLAIDWDQTALHLRYLSAQERAFVEDVSVGESLRAATEPITLNKCLEAFTREEQLDEEEKYYCSCCKTHQLASKKLQIWKLPAILIVHLKRFHYLNGRWIKSHKIVDFPAHDLDPAGYLAAVPNTTLARHKEIKQSVSSKLAKTVNCNGTISENGETTSNQQPALSDDSGIVKDQSLEDDSSSRATRVVNGHDDDDDGDDAAFGAPNSAAATDEDRGGGGGGIFSPKFGRRRRRQESTSLQTAPIDDNDLQDFHQHRLEKGLDPLDINYNMYAMVCHSGVLGGGHYISYGKNADKWYCHNDSSCKEISDASMDKSTAYMLFYEREGLSQTAYLPSVGRDGRPPPDTKDLDDELEMDFKKQCSVM